ncbi:MAG: hypothetical protein Q8O94_03890 [bacterium]|nr:hypothetical protein [bacterium]
MYFSIILDAVDGEVVRYKKNFSVRGVYLDLVNHLVVQEMFFLGLTLWVSEIWSTPNIFVLISGVLGALTMSIRRANGDIHRVLFVRPYSRNPQMFALPSLQPKAQPKAKEDTKKSFLSTTVVLIKKGLYEIHESAFMLIAVAVVYAGELLFFPNIPHYPLLSWTIIFFGATSCAYLVKEIIGNFYSMETKIALIENDFKSIHQ